MGRGRVRSTGGKPAAKPRAYDTRVAQLLQAIAIAETAWRASTRLTRPQKKQVLDGLAQTRQLASNPEPAFRNVRSLAYLEQTVIQPWNETIGEDADAFWKRISEAGLGYQRTDVIRPVLSRGRIKDMPEYELICDLVESQEQPLGAANLARLQRMIAAFERSRSK